MSKAGSALIATVLALMGTLAPMSTRAVAEPVTVRDAFGREVTVAAPPQRIVTIFASNTEMVAALGLAGRIVGIEAYTRFPPEVLGKPLVGGRLGFSVDAVVERKPDLVVVTPARQAANQLVEPMERLDIPVLVLLHRRMTEILDNIRLLGKICGVAERGAALAAELQGRLDKVRREVEGKPQPSVVMITGRLGNGLLLIARPGTYTGDAVLTAGGRFALDSGAIAQVSPEAILKADPDVLLFAGSDKDMKELIVRPGWADMRAVRAGRAHTVNRAELLIPGPRTFAGVEKLAAILHPSVVIPRPPVAKQ
ncbi:MAG: ABC transporter substrate-binding protein [Alphaproteobacteria bacterium 65-37]|nr:ABC transporter substrate-binding protein [Alphaproteobacteria bacterium]OJU36408.1 MAG: ABC transporter substrate-binding protein [Alphaproteobacteria bacterium 65-37]